MTTLNDPLKRAADSLDEQAKRHEDHVAYLRAELVKAEAAGKQARTDAAAIRQSIGE